MAGNYYECPYCGEHLDWGEKHKCEPVPIKIVNEKLAPKESEPKIDYSTDPETVAAREAVLAQIRALQNTNKN